MLIILIIGLASAISLNGDCAISASGAMMSSVLVACDTPNGLELSVVTPDGRKFQVSDPDDVTAHAVATGAVRWSPDGSQAAMEIALAEEPAVLLIDMFPDSPSASLIDTYSSLDVSLADPEWHPSGRWLFFHSSGTGERITAEGIYALRLSDLCIFRLYVGNVSDVAVDNETIYAIRGPLANDPSHVVLTISLGDDFRNTSRRDLTRPSSTKNEIWCSNPVRD